MLGKHTERGNTALVRVGSCCNADAPPGYMMLFCVGGHAFLQNGHCSDSAPADKARPPGLPL
jgi:hypothetical protein